MLVAVVVLSFVVSFYTFGLNTVSTMVLDAFVVAGIVVVIVFFALYQLSCILAITISLNLEPFFSYFFPKYVHLFTALFPATFQIFASFSSLFVVVVGYFFPCYRSHNVSLSFVVLGFFTVPRPMYSPLYLLHNFFYVCLRCTFFSALHLSAYAYLFCWCRSFFTP